MKVPAIESGCFFPRLLLVHEGFRFLSLMIKQPIRRATTPFVAKKMLCTLLQLNEQPRSQGSLLPVPTERRAEERTWEWGCWLKQTWVWLLCPAYIKLQVWENTFLTILECPAILLKKNKTTSFTRQKPFDAVYRYLKQLVHWGLFHSSFSLSR